MLDQGRATSSRKYMTQKLYPRHGEFTLGQANRQSMLTTEEEDLTEMINVLLQTGAKHQDIIDIGETIRKISKDGIHHPLEGVSRVPETKGQA